MMAPACGPRPFAPKAIPSRAMLIAVIAVAAGAAFGLARGGRLPELGLVRLRAWWLLAGGAGAELVASRWVTGEGALAVAIAGYALLLGFAAANIRLTGMILVTVGLMSNLVVIAVDSGMPVRGQQAGVTLGPLHHGQATGDHLTGLGDVVHIAPLDEQVSAGDLVLALGAAVVTVSLLRPRPRRSAVPSSS